MQLESRSLFLLVFFFTVTPLQFTTALGANPVTPGSLSLMSTFECISAEQPYTGDDNNTAAGALEFREVGQSAWLSAYTPYLNRNNDTMFGSIVGLQPDTAYEVRSTWSDGDGVGGSTQAADTVRTLRRDPPRTGGDIYIENMVHEDIGAVDGTWAASGVAFRRRRVHDIYILNNTFNTSTAPIVTRTAVLTFELTAQDRVSGSRDQVTIVIKPNPVNDFDGDFVSDIAVYAEDGTVVDWYILDSSTETTRQQDFGWAATLPFPGDYTNRGIPGFVQQGLEPCYRYTPARRFALDQRRTSASRLSR